MSIGKFAGAALTLSVAFSLAGCRSDGVDPGHAESTPAAAWWYAMEFEPVSRIVHGIDVARFDSSWSRADALGARMLESRVEPGGLSEFHDSGLSLSLTADLDGDGTDEDFFVGVFAANDGSRGRFLAITRDGRLLHHFTQSGTAGFSALLAQGDEVRWYKCLQCGDFDSIRWAGSSYALE
ncbi:hypothetical protein N799_03530 [Lysobacter arseniciresistens ZS79]|uniref:Lipoprotein n=1 Tax=Lysobacter arseniciresistens ZS79 TaxID=913325 RepID=A0A0A0F142_9GAMM|nr:hypothetical protein [Lysobacter arseniciresistens]KGM56499.1 hypothetical protein N799_03530 [Lysobacter arseniciresistens ZS79]